MSKYAKTVRRVRDEMLKAALNALGSTADEVAESLKALRFKGVRNDPGACPVANFMLETVPEGHLFEAAATGMYFKLRYKRQEVAHVRGSDVPAVRQFVHDFDCGKYPELDANVIVEHPAA